jgi:hypothetical protein
MLKVHLHARRKVCDFAVQCVFNFQFWAGKLSKHKNVRNDTERQYNLNSMRLVQCVFILLWFIQVNGLFHPVNSFVVTRYQWIILMNKISLFLMGRNQP